jgi:gas vesicle protein
MADNDNGGLGWFLAGLGIGALVGVLYAPKSGKETREDLKASAFDARDRAAKLYSDTTDQVTDYVRQGKDAANEYVDKGREYYEKGRSQWNEYVDKGKDLIQNQADAAKAAVEAGKSAYVEKTTTAPPLV